MLQANGITYEIETPDGPLKLLDNVSFNVPRGHFMAVVGPSGCGKTTLLKAIAGMIAETGGRFSGMAMIWLKKTLNLRKSGSFPSSALPMTS
ncbi:MAG: ATP-binding cassette domain-containing protein [Akkermansia sp.]